MKIVLCFYTVIIHINRTKTARLNSPTAILASQSYFRPTTVNGNVPTNRNYYNFEINAFVIGYNKSVHTV